MDSLIRKTALITGASSGLGVDFAELLAADGYDVILVARTESRLREVAEKLARQYGVQTFVIPSDLSLPSAPEAIASELQSRRLDVDVLVNNAGYGMFGPFVETDLRKELDMIAVNITALTHLTKLVVPAMVRRGSGRVLNVASTAAFQPGPLMAVYYATKAYVLSFSEALRNELNGTGVTVTALCPGPTKTGFQDAADLHESRLLRLNKPMQSRKVAAAGLRGMHRGRSVVVPGAMNLLLAESVRFLPRNIVTAVTRQVQEKVG